MRVGCIGNLVSSDFDHKGIKKQEYPVLEYGTLWREIEKMISYLFLKFFEDPTYFIRQSRVSQMCANITRQLCDTGQGREQNQNLHIN